MATIYFVMCKQAAESVMAFKQRCADVLTRTRTRPGDPATSIGRLTYTPDGLESTFHWGQAHGDVLPGDTCVIASITEDAERLSVHPFSTAEFDSAPRDPDLTPWLCFDALAVSDLDVAPN
jgi:hypothetical protein